MNYLTVWQNIGRAKGEYDVPPTALECRTFAFSGGSTISTSIDPLVCKACNQTCQLCLARIHNMQSSSHPKSALNFNACTRIACHITMQH